MFATLVGNIVAIDRRINNSKLTQVTVAENFAGQTVTDGSWGKRESGFFRLRVWEEQKQVGTNTDFTKFLDMAQKGSTVEVLVEITELKTVKEGQVTDRRPTMTALRFNFVGGKRPETEATQTQTERPVRAAQASASDESGWVDVPSDDEDTSGYTPDALSM